MSSIMSVNEFEKKRTTLTNFVRDIIIPFLENPEYSTAIVRAPVKSGKRGMVELVSLLDYSPIAQKRVHAFISGWHRKADDPQREELRVYHLEVFSITSIAAANKCYAWIQSQLNAGKTVVAHLDECDHGSGNRQILNKLWINIRNLERVKKILYSATPEEVCFSGELNIPDELSEDTVDNDCMMRYSPAESDGFCGPQKFLDEGLVTEATRFFVKTPTGYYLTEQGKAIVQLIEESIKLNPRRNILVLRLSYADGKGKQAKAIHQFLSSWKTFPELKGFAITVDKGDVNVNFGEDVNVENIKWSNRKWWENPRQIGGVPWIIVCDQTSSRSTEWACHDRIVAAHDYRKNVVFTVLQQAQERPNHYVNQNDYNGFQRIRIYGSVKTFQLSAGHINYEQYLANEWEMRKVDRRSSGGLDLYNIRKSSDHTLHPDHSGQMSKEDAEYILSDLGCLATSEISSRVKGSVKDVPVVATEFIPCTKETFPTVREWPARVQNPFVNSELRGLDDGKYKNYIRGEWAVRSYEETVNERWGFGNTTERRLVCYKDGVVGVYYGKVTHTVKVNTLDAYKSMYSSRR